MRDGQPLLDQYFPDRDPLDRPRKDGSGEPEDFAALPDQDPSCFPPSSDLYLCLEDEPVPWDLFAFRYLIR